MRKFDEIYDFAKAELSKEMNVGSFQRFVEEIQKRISNEISEFLSVDDIYKLGVLLYFLEKEAKAYNVPHKLDSLIDVLKTIPAVLGGVTYNKEPLINILENFANSDRKEMKKIIQIEFV